MAKTAKQPTEKKTAAAKPAPKKTAKVETKKSYKPTAIALVLDGKKPSIIVGARRIAATKFEVVEKSERYWSQLSFLKIGKTAAGKFVLTTAREAAAKKLEIL